MELNAVAVPVVSKKRKKKLGWKESLHVSAAGSSELLVSNESEQQQQKQARSKTNKNASGMISGNEQVVRECIKSIMYAFGDRRTVQDVSVDVTMDILGRQVQELVRSASQSRDRTKGPVGVVDILTVYKNDVNLVHRLFKRLQARYQARKLQQAMAQDEVIDMQDSGDKLMKEIRVLAEQIDPDNLCKAFDARFVDPTAQDRLARLDSRTKAMSNDEYLEFHKARLVSFVSQPSNQSAFVRWALSDSLEKVSPTAIELICLIAYEIVAKLIEAAIAEQQSNTVKTEVGGGSLQDFMSRNPLNLSERQLALIKRRKLRNAPEALGPDQIKSAFDKLLAQKNETDPISTRLI